MRMRAFGSLAVMLWAAVAQADSPWENRCLEVTWKTNDQLMTLLNQQGAQGWQLATFLKGSRPCMKRLKASPHAIEHMCTTFRWRNVDELSDVLNGYSDQGWELVGSSRPSQLCMVRASGAQLEAPKPRPPATAADASTPAPRPVAVEAKPAQPQTKPATAAKAKPQSAEDKTRGNAKELHKQLSKEELKQQLAAGEISQEEYDARIKEIEQQ